MIHRTEELKPPEVGAQTPAEMMVTMLDAMPAKIGLLNQEGRLLAVNGSWSEGDFGMALDRAPAEVGQDYLQYLEQTEGICEETARTAAEGIRRVLRGENAEYELEYLHQVQNEERWIRLNVLASRVAGARVAVLRQVNITDERLTQAKIHRLNRLYAVSSAINSAIVRMADAPSLYEEACRIAVEQGGLVMAWVGLVEEGSEAIVPVARWGRDEGYLAALQISTSSDVAGGKGPAGRAFRSGEPATCDDIKADQGVFASREAALARGLRGCAAFPLRVAARSIGVFAVYSDVANYFDTEEIRLLEALTQNLSFAVEAQRDLQERRRAEAELRASEASMAAAQRVANFGSWQLELANPTDIDANPLRWSDEMYRIAGFEPGEVEVTNELFFELTHPQDREFVRAAVGEAIRERKSYSVVHRLIRRDGEERVVHETAQIFFDEASGAPVKMIGTAHDITEQRRALEKIQQGEALLRVAGRVSRLGAWAVDLPDFQITWSDEVCAIHGMPAGFVPPLAEGLDYYAPEYREAVTEMFMRCAAHGDAFDTEAQLITAQGKRVWVRAIGEAELDADGSVKRVQGALQDISDRKRAEEETRQLAARLTGTLESITDAFFTIDREMRLTYVNHEAERVWQRKREDLLGKNLWEEFPEANGSAFQTGILAAMEDKVARQFEAKYEPLDRWFEMRCYPSEYGIAVYFRDVGHERQARETVRESEERFRLLSKATNDAVWDWNLVTDEVWWNDGFQTLFGYRREEVEKTIESWTTRIHEEDRERTVAHIQRVIDGDGDVFVDEYRFRRKDGSYAYVLDRGHVLRNAEGVGYRMIGGMTDLTERMQAEERIAEQAALIDEARDAIVVQDLEHRITFWSKGAERRYGWTATEAIGQRFDELLKVPPAKFEGAKAGTHRTGEWIGEIEHLDKEGKKHVLDSRWTLLRDKEQRAKSILTIDTDITEKKKMELQFLRAQRMESIGTLAGGIAHDLNNVLAPILMSIELLQMRYDDPEARETLETIASSAERGAEMVRQVLSFARGIEGERIPIQLKHLLGDLRKFVYDTFPKNIDFRFNIPRELGVIIGDPTQLYQVMLNLCVNARDAMLDGGTLKVRVEDQVLDEQFAAMEIGAKAGDYVLLEVEDTGQGIAQENLDKIFEPFFTTKELGKGTGLGLSTTLAIVKSHGGFVRVISEPGGGARFQVYLPAQKGTEVAEKVRREEAPRRGQGELILVVDDEPMVRDITRMTLEGFGYRAVTADNGASALAVVAMQVGEIAAVVTDMMMPVMDGPALIRALRKMAPDLPVIAASGIGTESTRERATEAGASYFVPKPYTAGALLKMLATVLPEGGAPKG